MRTALAWVLLVASVVGWGLSLAGVIAQGEPPFTLSLSWLAITITALDVLFTAQVKESDG